MDLKAGEMHRGDFAIAGCEAAVADEIKARAKALDRGDETLAAVAGTQLATEARAVPDVKALPASGIVGAPGQAGGDAGHWIAPAGSSPRDAVRERPRGARRRARPIRRPGCRWPRPSPRAEPLEKLVPGLDKKLGFVGLKDGDMLPYAQATIRVKGTAGATFKLTVNGAEVPESRIGKRATLAEKQVQAWEYVGVELKPGANELSVAQVDAFGNPRGTVTIRVIAPGRAAKLVIEVPKEGAIADGRTLARVVVKLLDENGVPVTSRTPVTLVSSLGLWKVDDPDPRRAGRAGLRRGRARRVPARPAPRAGRDA